MIKALDSYVRFIQDYGREPSKEEFIQDCGYSKTTYYRVKGEYSEYMQARVEEQREGGNPVLTFEDDVAERFIGG